MVRILFGVSILACVVSSVSTAQSLGDVAKRERERREKNKEQGVAVREISEDQIFDDDAEDTVESSTEEGEEDAPADASEENRFDLELVPSEGGGVEELDRARTERQKQEAEWRARVAQAKSRIDEARARKAQLDGLALSEGQRYEDVHGKTVIRSLAHLQQLVAEAADELRAAEEALVALREEARRAGVPPGWLR